MSININNLPNTAQVKADKTDQAASRQQTAVEQNVTNQAIKKQDSVSITPQAQQFSKLQEKAANSSGIDQEKIDKIKQAIADGKYKINVDVLAKRIMQFEGDLFDRK